MNNVAMATLLTRGVNSTMIKSMKKAKTVPKSSLSALADPKKQAQWFQRVRDAHQTETAEDYVELIADLIEANGEARVVDLSQRFGVSHATVNKVILRLKKEGLVMPSLTAHCF
jgi:DtxR family transcriptional regulator, manganese transport regulator